MKKILTIIFIAILTFGFNQNINAQEDSDSSPKVVSKGSHGNALNLLFHLEKKLLLADITK